MDIQVAKLASTKNYGKSVKETYDVIPEKTYVTILRQIMRVAKDNRNPVFDRQIACIIGVVMTTGLPLTYIAELNTNDVISHYNEDLKHDTGFIKINVDGYAYEQYCCPLAFEFLFIAKEVRQQYDSTLSLIFVAENRTTHKIIPLGWTQFARYSRNLMEKYSIARASGMTFCSIYQFVFTYDLILEESRKRVYKGEVLPKDSLYCILAEEK